MSKKMVIVTTAAGVRKSGGEMAWREYDLRAGRVT